MIRMGAALLGNTSNGKMSFYYLNVGISKQKKKQNTFYNIYPFLGAPAPIW